MATAQILQPAFRSIPSRYPTVQTFETVSSADDLEAVLELEGWTNDRLVAERLARLPRSEWVFGTPNASIVMASFLHAAPAGQRFSGPEIGAWYAALSAEASLAEVAHHLRREAINSNMTEMRGQYRTYSCALAGNYEDIRGQRAARAELYHTADYSASQVFGEDVRLSGDGIVYDSLRYEDGVNVVAYRPKNVRDILQRDHYELTVPIEGKIIVRKLAAQRDRDE
jgi:hypothetical protein